LESKFHPMTSGCRPLADGSDGTRINEALVAIRVRPPSLGSFRLPLMEWIVSLRRLHGQRSRHPRQYAKANCHIRVLPCGQMNIN
jgi:hypothetical protein